MYFYIYFVIFFNGLKHKYLERRTQSLIYRCENISLFNVIIVKRIKKIFFTESVN